jgi:hypothetical protein
MRLLVKAFLTIKEMRTAMEAQQAVLEVYREGVDLLQRQVLEERRERLALASAWRIACEQPEVDIRDELDAMIRGLQDEVAQIEEQVC